jgi:hypothetical protein
MTIQSITTRLAAIEDAKGDPETAHSMEDRLRWDFIKYVKERSRTFDLHLYRKAAEVLKSDDIDFERGYK